MSEVTVIVHMHAKPGKEDALADALRAAVPPTHEEAGCIRFALHRSTNDPADFLLVERWTSTEALNAHLKQHYLVRLLEELKEYSQSVTASNFEMLPEGQAEKLL